MAPEVFPGHDEPVTIEGEPDDALRLLLTQEVGEGEPETVEPVLDE
jgi:hypothetical protein